MKRPWLLIGTMLVSVSLSWLTFHGIDVAPYGLPQIVLFSASTIIAGFCAFKAFSGKSIWVAGIGCLVVLYLAMLFYLLCIF